MENLLNFRAVEDVQGDVKPDLVATERPRAAPGQDVRDPYWRVANNMRQDVVANMLQGAGNRVKMVAATFIQTYLQGADRNNADLTAVIAMLVTAGTPNPPVDSKAYTVIQACAVGFGPQDGCTNREALNTVRQGVFNTYPNAVDAARRAIFRDGAPPQWNTIDAITMEQIQGFTRALAALPTQKSTTMKLWAQAVVAYCKQGNVTNNVVNKVAQAFRDELMLNIDIEVNTIRVFWNVVHRWFSDTEAAHFFKEWEDMIGGASLRMRLICQQASWCGMTNFENIKKAKELFPTFPWAEAASIFPGDFAAYEAARGVVRDNRYYGYRTDLREAKSTNYPNLCYLAYTLLTDIGGDRSLRDFRGTNRNTPHAADIDQMIIRFRTARQEGRRAVNDGDRIIAQNFLNPPALPAPQE